MTIIKRFRCLLEKFIQSRFERDGYEISQFGAVRINADWLVKQPEVQEKIRALERLIANGTIKFNQS